MFWFQRRRMNLYHTDCESLWYYMKSHEKHLKRKRRWLMGLPTSKSKRKQLIGPKFLNNRSLPESLIRGDDVFYETVKTCVEEAFGACNVQRGHHVVQDNMRVVDVPNITRVLKSHLDDLTNKGLYLLAMILTGGSVKFEKTRWKMKKVIREFLPKILKNQNHNDYQMEVSTQLSQLLNNPHNFQENCVSICPVASQSHQAAVIKVLDGLEDLPLQALEAMRKKLEGVQGDMPQIQLRRSRLNRNFLISRVRKTCEKMLSELGKGDELQEPLAKAMVVAGLSSKLTGFQSPAVTEFHRFSSEIETLQNEIAKAISLIQKKFKSMELKNLRLLFDPNTEISNSRLRTAIEKLLTEYLFECSDMDAIPKSLLETLAIINSSRSTPHRCFPKEEIEEEVECILSVSAQTKQIVLDLLPDNEFDQDFADAYIEDLEESDDGGYSGGGGGGGGGGGVHQQELNNPHNSWFHLNGSNHLVEGSGESNPIVCSSPTSTAKRNDSSPLQTPNKKLNNNFVERLEPEHITGIDSVDPQGASSSQFQKLRFLIGTQNMDLNQNQVESMDKSGRSMTYGNGFSSLHSPSGRLNGNSFERRESECNTGMDSSNSPDFFSSDFSCGETKFMSNKQDTCRNQYLAIQEICDETSMVAYRLIGHLLGEFAQVEGLDLDWSDVLYLRGDNSIPEDSQAAKEKQTSSRVDGDDSVIVRVVEQLIPSFSKSGIEKVKELMCLR